MKVVDSEQSADGSELWEGELPKGWVETVLEDVGIISTGNTPSKNDPDNYGEDVPFVKPGDLENSGPICSTNEMLSFKGAKSARLINPNAVMITCIGNLGRVGIAGKELATNQQINSIQFLENFVLPRFGYFQSLGLKEWLEANSSATTLPIINKRRFSKAPFILPPLNEQKRIVTKLDAIMPRIEAVKARLDKVPGILKHFRQSVLSAAVTGKLTEQWREEHPEVESAEVLLERIRKEREERYKKEFEEARKKGGRKPKKLSEYTVYQDTQLFLPDGWLATSPDEISSPEQYSLAIGPFGSNLKVSDYTSEGVPIVFVKNIRSEDFKSNRKYVSLEKAKELIQHTVRAGDLLITKMGDPPGDCCMYPEGLENAIITSDCLKFSTWKNFIETDFYNIVLNSFIIKNQLIDLTQGVAQQKISLERFKSIQLPLPPLDEQQEIVRQVDKLFALADKVEVHYQKAKTKVDKLSQSVLAKAFRGELVPQDPSDEPAEKLLERILEEKAKLESGLKGTRKRGSKK